MAVPSLAAEERDSPIAPPSLVARAAGLIAEYGPAAIILTLPLEFTARITRQPLTRWAMVITAAAFLYLLLTRRRTLVLPRVASAVALALLVVYAIASWLRARAPGSTPPLLDVALYPFVALMLMNLLLTPREQARAWTAFLASALGVAVLGFVLYVTHLTIWTPNPVVAHRLNITFADPNITARFLTLGAAAAVILFATRHANRWLAIATALACAAVVPLTYSRSGLALLVLSLALAVAVAGLAAKQWRRALAVAACAIVLFGASVLATPDTRFRALEAEATVASLVTGNTVSVPGGGASAQSSTDVSALEDNRRYLIAAGVRMFEDHPLLGVGFGAYQHRLATTYRHYIPSNVPNPDVASHTAFITIAAELGAVGLLILFALLVLLAREAVLNRRIVYATTAATLIVPIILYSQFEGRFLEEPYLWLMLALFYGAIAGRRMLKVGSHNI